MTKVKICGLSRREDIAYVNAFKPDFIGFVFYEKSKRAVTLEKALELKSLLAQELKAVGVFVNAPLEFVAELAALGAIDLIQLHGDEDVEYCKKLRLLTDAPLIKAVRVRGRESLVGLEKYPVDYFLFDTYQSGVYGGTGQRFDVKLGEDIPKPFFIAGGLDAGNVAEVIKKNKPFAVDVSGGVETDGFKDPQKIAAFIASVRGEKNND